MTANKRTSGRRRRWFFRGLALLVLLAATTPAAVWWYLHPTLDRTNGFVYGHRHGKPLMLDILRPHHPNGLGIVTVVSGSWKSGSPGSLQAWIVAPLLRRGYTVFAVYHLSQPEASVPEIIQDIHRAVRFVRYHAQEYGVDPDRLGITGGSAGGHLSLMVATRGGPGPEDASDPVDRASSAVQAAAVFFPVTDLLNLGRSTENPGDGGPPRSYRHSFGPGATNLPVWRVVGRECSPIYWVHSNLPPILIVHGDADRLVPLEQSEWFLQAAAKMGAEVCLEVHRGGGHGWWTMPWDIRRFGRWFDQHLKPKERADPSQQRP